MAIAQRQRGPQQAVLAGQGAGGGGPSGLADVLEVLLDKGLVIDAFVRVSLVGIELLTIDARVVVASVDTYLRFAEAVNRLDLLQAHNSQTVGDLLGGGPASGGDERKSSRALSGTSSEPDEDGDQPAESGNTPDESGELPEAESSTDDDEASNEDEDKGLLSRIKERGQVF